MEELQIKLVEVPCEIKGFRCYVYRIPRTELTDKIMKAKVVLCRNVTATSYDIPGTVKFLKTWNKERLRLDPTVKINVDCSSYDGTVPAATNKDVN